MCVRTVSRIGGPQVEVVNGKIVVRESSLVSTPIILSHICISPVHLLITYPSLFILRLFFIFVCVFVACNCGDVVILDTGCESGI